jgi:hypothetical protein
MQEFIAEVSELEPPDRVADAHGRFLGALQWFDEYFGDFLTRARSALTTEEQSALNEEFVDPSTLADANQAFVDACSELQEAGNAEAIEVNLNCDGSSSAVEEIDELLKGAPGEPEPPCGGDASPATPPPTQRDSTGWTGSACFCEIGSCPEEVRVIFNGMPGRILLNQPPLPANLTLVSVYIEFDPGAAEMFEGKVKLPLPNLEDTETGLGFYSHIDGTWEWQADVTLTHEHLVASGELASLPPNLAVLRATD